AAIRLAISRPTVYRCAPARLARTRPCGVAATRPRRCRRGGKQHLCRIHWARLFARGWQRMLDPELPLARVGAKVSDRRSFLKNRDAHNFQGPARFNEENCVRPYFLGRLTKKIVCVPIFDELRQA